MIAIHKQTHAVVPKARSFSGTNRSMRLHFKRESKHTNFCKCICTHGETHRHRDFRLVKDVLKLKKACPWLKCHKKYQYPK